MKTFARIVEMTKQEHAEYIENNELLRLVASGRMTRQHYIAYLRETYHLVRHTPRMLALGGARLTDDKRAIRNWFFEQILEENSHDLFCVKDLQHLGENPEVILDSQPGAGAWGMITQNYFMATYGNPIGILGVATATEGLGAQFGSKFADLLNDKYGLPGNAVTFLRSHGGFDVKHLEEAVEAIELVTDPVDIQAIVHARRMTCRYYGQLFLDVLAADKSLQTAA